MSDGRNQYASVCYICNESVAAMGGMLDGKNAQGRTRVRHVGCLPIGNPLTDYASDAPASDPFGKRAARAAPENVPALKDHLSEAEAALSSLEEGMEGVLDNVTEWVGAALDARMADAVPAMVAAEMDAHRKLSIEVGKAAPVVIDVAHKILPELLEATLAGATPMLVGPSGSGKTTLAEQIAKALGLPFYMAARVTSEFKLMGYTTAVGAIVRTQFREAFEKGGVFLFDEIDASDPDALTSFNAALGNGLGDFPDGMVRKHKDFYAVAAANTFGRGADRQYVGRNQLDAATLDRFQVFEVNYDEDLEAAIAPNEDWTLWVQSIRAAIEAEKVRHIVSPRASIIGGKMLARGMSRKQVEEACVWKGLDAPSRQRIVMARVPREKAKAFDPDRKPGFKARDDSNGEG
jgi:MoxR-like ATPase